MVPNSLIAPTSLCLRRGRALLRVPQGGAAEQRAWERWLVAVEGACLALAAWEKGHPGH